MSNNLIGFGSLEGLSGSCGCSGRRAGMAGFGASPDGIGAGPDGIGATLGMNGISFAPLAIMAVIGGTVGYFAGGMTGRRLRGQSPVVAGLAAGAATGAIGFVLTSLTKR